VPDRTDDGDIDEFRHNKYTHHFRNKVLLFFPIDWMCWQPEKGHLGSSRGRGTLVQLWLGRLAVGPTGTKPMHITTIMRASNMRFGAFRQRRTVCAPFLGKSNPQFKRIQPSRVLSANNIPDR